MWKGIRNLCVFKFRIHNIMYNGVWAAGGIQGTHLEGGLEVVDR